VASLGKEQYSDYEHSLKIYRDLKNSIDTAYDTGKFEGKIEGKREGKIETARAMKKDGLPISTIAKYTGLTEAEVDKLEHP
jgi:predicted transposase/invertase (TIGR01784 family)